MSGLSRTKIALSIVSHGQAALAAQLLSDIERYCGGVALSVLLTLNVPEPSSFSPKDFSFPLSLIRNPSPKGFGANHNAAFRQAHADYFCVLNPDIRLLADPFMCLIDALSIARTALAAPLVLGPTGDIEDSARRVPTPLSLAKKVFHSVPRPDYRIDRETIHPDWVGGMFMCFKSEAFARLGGFDDHYFLYYEDVDLCCRLRLAGFDISLVPAARVVHDARRQSRRSLRYLRWHFTSILRFFTSPVFYSFLRLRAQASKPEV